MRANEETEEHVQRINVVSVYIMYINRELNSMNLVLIFYTRK